MSGRKQLFDRKNKVGGTKMKELFLEKKVLYDDNYLVIEIDNIAEKSILENHLDSIISYYK